MTAIVALLFVSEVSNYLYKEHAYEFFVDNHIGDEMQVNVDMTVAMQCHCESIAVLEYGG